MKRIALSMAFRAIAIGAGLAACSSAHQPVPTSSKTAAPQQVQIPNAVKVPSGNKLAGSFEGHGVQIYQCTSNSWTLLQPAAIIGDNGNRRFERESAAKHAEPIQDALLCLAEQVVAPLDRGLQLGHCRHAPGGPDDPHRPRAGN